MESEDAAESIYAICNHLQTYTYSIGIMSHERNLYSRNLYSRKEIQKRKVSKDQEKYIQAVEYPYP